MITTFALHPAASKLLIARGVAQLPQVRQALEHGKIIVGSGTTNIRIAEQLLSINIDNPQAYVAGVISQQVACATDPEQRAGNWCIERGKLVQVDWLEFLDSFGREDIFIKGANALDPMGNVGILLGNDKGGTIGQAIGMLKARGIEIITPVGLEKMIPSCLQAEKMMGIYRDNFRLGLKVGYMALANTTIITEIESLALLLGIEAVQVASGGVGGMEGAVMLAAKCNDQQKSQELLTLVKKYNRTSPLKVTKKKCADCSDRCFFMHQE